MNKACYRKLSGYKYQLVDAYPCSVGIEGYDIDGPFLNLTPAGLLTIKKGYAWDGPSGPTIDTDTFMRGALLHDALYQLIRMEKLPYELKDHADRLLRDVCRCDGMSWVRAWYVYHAVRIFGGSSARPGTEESATHYCVPSET